MTTRASRAVATTLALLALAMEVAAGVLFVRDTAATGVTLDANGVATLILGASFPVVGWLITSRRPDNRIGWMFLAAGVVFALGPLSSAYAEYGLVVAPGSSPLADVAAWLSSLSWVPAYTLMILLLLLFPDGHLPSRRWRPILWIAAVSAVLMLVPSAIASWPDRAVLLTGGSPESAGNPALATADLLQGVGLSLSAVVAVAGGAALISRFRRSLGTERQQIKLFATAAIAEMAVLIPMASGAIQLPAPVDALVAVIVTPLIPIAVGVAILRYRLYDIDRIVSRTVSYGAVTGILALVFLGTILVLQTVLASFFSGDTIAVAASTLVAAALFQPLRRRVQRAVDRRFDRARYDGQRTVDAFAEHLRSDVDLGSLRASLEATADRAVRPVSASVWLSPRGTR